MDFESSLCKVVLLCFPGLPDSTWRSDDLSSCKRRRIMLRSAAARLFRSKRGRTFCESPHQSHAQNCLDETPANVLLVPLDRIPDLNPAVREALSLDNASKSQKLAARISEVKARFRRSPSDTGSPEVQVAIATERIKNLTGHLHTHRKDQNTRRGLLQLVQNRRKMLKYLLRQSPERYLELVQNLGLREGAAFSNDVGTLGAKNHPSPRLRRN